MMHKQNQKTYSDLPAELVHEIVRCFRRGYQQPTPETSTISARFEHILGKSEYVF